MAQGDITLFDWAANTLLTQPGAGARLYGWPITDKTVAAYDDSNPQVSDYEVITSLGSWQFPYTNPYYGYSTKIASMKSTSVLVEPKPDAVNADKVFQIILGFNTVKLLGFMDVTDDGGVTPWNLQEVPMRITFPDFGAVTSVVFNVEVA